MDKHPSFLLLFFLILSQAAFPTAVTDLRSAYIIHVSPSLQPSTSPTPFHWYSSTLRSLPRHLRHPIGRIIYTYDRVIVGFAAILTDPQAAALRLIPHILAVIPDSPSFPHITHTPSFLHLSPSSGLWPQSSFASSIVIAVLDTGIYPYSSSFIDPDLSDPPTTFHTSCDFHNSSACSNKLVGAKFYYKGYEAYLRHPIDETLESKSPLDTKGHGTHTASTAAGAVVSGASFLGYAEGEARGIATKARIAVYKICWAGGCFQSDILAAMDDAVSDGANVISFSVGSKGYPKDYFRDTIAIGAFGAALHGVIVSCSAGNSGPGDYTVGNVAPWIITVGASTVDRNFPADVVLGDGSIYNGVSLYAGSDNITTANLPLVYGGDAGSAQCVSGLLDSSIVADKIVLCDRGKNGRIEKGRVVKLAGGAGMIVANTEENGEDLTADPHLIPATMVGASAGNKIRAYIRSDSSPTATIVFHGTFIGGDPPAPKVASFSSRGPNYRTPEILKPDVIAPGVNILAAWTRAASPTNLDDIDSRRVDFNIISGTSMACPHVSGIAALLRGVYPDWSTAAIKSAIMTTAYNLDDTGGDFNDLATGKKSNPFIHGAGHVDPNKALDPGLVYDAGIDDYLAFLCSIHYSKAQISLFTRDGSSVDCSSKTLANPGDLNYPSFSVIFSSLHDVVTYKRTVKNVGGLGCGDLGCRVYNVEISSPPEVDVKVSPSKLVFDSVNQSLSYEITFASIKSTATSRQFGWISWSDGVHKVRSPIAVIWQQQHSQVSTM
ncbi:subtilisin-like protease SBT1.4 [Dendrobium catenatum]|uniref:Subtilisin-like protease n=1 Tax=Dendrobium catenatum TaxID=906689 RepID=A0A2I0V930_9ASPA|nr:subtilisin-like protease SBT1.4 [Dendrobium catenatum]PKU59912.1 Subtilisin-like protease [Dendrobium catenatum]